MGLPIQQPALVYLQHFGPERVFKVLGHYYSTGIQDLNNLQQEKYYDPK